MPEFQDLPIWFDATETSEGGWRRTVKRLGSIAELLETWDIDDGDAKDMDEVAQVLRYLRKYVSRCDKQQRKIEGMKSDAPPV